MFFAAARARRLPADVAASKTPPLANTMQRLLIALGLLLLLAGIAWPWLSKLPWGRLPGDIAIEREGFGFYFPLATSLLVSVVVSLLLWWWLRR